MTKRLMIPVLLAAALAVLPGAVRAGDEAVPAVDDPMKSLQAMCEASAEARTARHNATPLYERLGGYERIHALTTEIVRLHLQNEDIKGKFVHVDPAALAGHVADFMAAGTGGTAKYTGRTLPDSHAHLGLTDADFLAAGGDIVKAMQNLGYGQQEIDEVVCILVSLKDQVVLAGGGR